MSEVKHTPGLNREQIFAIAEPYGAFGFGDAQGHKRLEFAADVIAAHERLRDAAPDLLNAAHQALSDLEWIESQHPKNNFQSSIILLRHAITQATGSAA